MCGSCGCSEHDPAGSVLRTVEVRERILSANDRQAEVNRQLFDSAGVLAVNLVSSPGAGKTSLLEKTVEWTGGKLRIGRVISMPSWFMKEHGTFLSAIWISCL